MTANPSRAWRVSIDAAEIGAITSVSAPELTAFQAAYNKNTNDAKLTGIVDGPSCITTTIGQDTTAVIAPLPKPARTGVSWNGSTGAFFNES